MATEGGVIGLIKDIPYGEEHAVYRRGDGTHYKRVSKTHHVQVARFDDTKMWFEEGGMEPFDPDEEVVVIGAA